MYPHNSLTEGISKAVEYCFLLGKGQQELNDWEYTIIKANWETWEQNADYDVINVKIYQKGEMKLSYQLKETKLMKEKPITKPQRTTKKELLEMLEGLSDDAEIVLKVKDSSSDIIENYTQNQKVTVHEDMHKIIYIQDELNYNLEKLK
jgi:hypothetical protein